MYEICKPQEAAGAGGSWGLGKTVYFRICIGLVIYYSRIKEKDGYASRLAASCVENENDADAMIPLWQGKSSRGIAWWGVSVGDNATQPVTDEAYIVLPKYHTVIFVHGCFWHRHPGCKFAYSPKTRIDYWQAKFDANVRNDQKNIQLLKADGWNVLVLWECDIRKNFETTMENAVLKIEADMAYEHFVEESDN